VAVVAAAVQAMRKRILGSGRTPEYAQPESESASLSSVSCSSGLLYNLEARNPKKIQMIKRGKVI
jgi:hypothetical protein